MTRAAALAAARAALVATSRLAQERVIYARQDGVRPAVGTLTLRAVTETPQGYSGRIDADTLGARQVLRVQVLAHGQTAIDALADALVRLRLEGPWGVAYIRAAPLLDTTAIWQSGHEPSASVDLLWHYVRTASSDEPPRLDGADAVIVSPVAGPDAIVVDDDV